MKEKGVAAEMTGQMKEKEVKEKEMKLKVVAWMPIGQRKEKAKSRHKRLDG